MREPEFYWVKADGKWVIGEFSDNRWFFCGVEEPLYGDIGEIDERRIIREEPTE